MINTAKELSAACRKLASDYKTLYVLGCIGAPLNAVNRERYSKNLSYNKRSDRLTKIQAATASTFGFDCVCMIKSLLWGWEGDTGHVYGGAKYASRDIPDISANGMIAVCSDVSDDFSTLEEGEVVWKEDHIGVYVGDGLCVECTPAWEDGVQITAVHNIGKQDGYNGRIWQKHGKLPYVTYEKGPEKEPEKAVSSVPEWPVLKKGSNSDTAKALQLLLIGYGFSCGAAGADGVFGAATEAALRSYQSANNLVADGICGSNTWRKLLGMA